MCKFCVVCARDRVSTLILYSELSLAHIPHFVSSATVHPLNYEQSCVALRCDERHKLWHDHLDGDCASGCAKHY